MSVVFQASEEPVGSRMEYWRHVLGETPVPLDPVDVPDRLVAAVAGWIRQRRLERCRRDLLDPALRSRPVSAIAARWGMLNAAHFSRSFRAAYGVPPVTYRQLATDRAAGQGSASAEA